MAPFVSAHGSHGQESVKIKPKDISWQDWHMKEEHGLDEYDGQTFFSLHDLNNNGLLEPKEILNLYGLVHKIIVGDGSGMGQEIMEVPPELQDHAISEVFKAIKHKSPDGITEEEWLEFYKNGGEWPDLGFGSGHHLGFEEEYEEHHWNKYHANDDPDVKIKHKEDIEHELLHHKQEIEETHDRSKELKDFTKNYVSKIDINNLKPKYRKVQ
ncbi:hypothetical protein SBY92_002538 [Candida maltosa Xu316]|uniref:EF-hand domain-containing protein n=1 Tax=Candida maltosa (strain Xu316) TaxID=1245528 RepID=M3JVG4_CANMX|nr:hypothetical protein G210_3379 [Candida maltosa Xu316]